MHEPARRSKFRAFARLGGLVRAQEWIGITFCPLFISFYYLLLTGGGRYWDYIGGFALIIAFGVLCGSFAFVVNTLFDREGDRKADKRYAISAWSESRFVALLVGLCGASLLVAALLASRSKIFLLLGALVYLMSIAYSVPPF